MERTIENIAMENGLELINGKLMIGFESFEQAKEIMNEVGGYITYCEKKAGQCWKSNGNRAWEQFSLDAEDIGYVQMYDKSNVINSNSFNDEIKQCIEVLYNDLEDAESEEEYKDVKVRMKTLKEVAKTFSCMKMDETLLLGENWMRCLNYKVIPTSDLTTMSYEYDSTSYAIGLML